MFCPKCGTQLNGEPKFCNECGAKIAIKADSGIQSAQNDYTQCPSCGANLNAFETTCPSCGREVRNVDSISSVKRLETVLLQIEERRPPNAQKSSSNNDINPTDMQKAGCIEAFVIPSTKEDIVEFMLLAASNIDAHAIAVKGMHYTVDRSSYHVTKAWYSKFEQAYEKAKISLKNDPMLDNVQEIYAKKMREIQEEKDKERKVNIVLLSIIGGCFLFLILLAILACVFSDSLNTPLNAN